jgi:hypothetical protein
VLAICFIVLLYTLGTKEWDIVMLPSSHGRVKVNSFAVFFTLSHNHRGLVGQRHREREGSEEGTFEDRESETSGADARYGRHTDYSSVTDLCEAATNLRSSLLVEKKKRMILVL